jgi:hypothetical protein
MSPVYQAVMLCLLELEEVEGRVVHVLLLLSWTIRSLKSKYPRHTAEMNGVR